MMDEQEAKRAIFTLAKTSEEAREIAQYLSTLDWQQVFIEQKQIEIAREEQRRATMIRCPYCDKPEKLGEYEKLNMCRCCYQEVWDEQARPCLVCKVMFLPSGRYDRTYSVCESSACQKVVTQVQAQNIRARKAGLPATLLLQEWVDTLLFFELKCAYCQGKFDGLEHYLPINLGGGTTRGNCVPACYSCNTRKRGKRPDQFASLFPAQNMTRIREYLNTVSEQNVQTNVPVV